MFDYLELLINNFCHVDGEEDGREAGKSPWMVIITREVGWWASLAAQLVKNPPVMRETPVQSLEKGSATHSSILGLPRWLRQ